MLYQRSLANGKKLLVDFYTSNLVFERSLECPELKEVKGVPSARVESATEFLRMQDVLEKLNIRSAPEIWSNHLEEINVDVEWEYPSREK